MVQHCCLVIRLVVIGTFAVNIPKTFAEKVSVEKNVQILLCKIYS